MQSAGLPDEEQEGAHRANERGLQTLSFNIELNHLAAVAANVPDSDGELNHLRRELRGIFDIECTVSAATLKIRREDVMMQPALLTVDPGALLDEHSQPEQREGHRRATKDV